MRFKLMPQQHGLRFTRVLDVAFLTLCAIALDNVTIATNSHTPYVVVLTIASVFAATVDVDVVLCVRRAGYSLMAVAVMLVCGLACSFVLLDAAGRILWSLGSA